MTPSSEEQSYPLAAQIPLSSFTLPAFPPSAHSLRELTLTSDIPLPSYQALVTSGAEYELPQLPESIRSLTFELFSLGFPGRNPKFLTNLAKAAPGVESVTFFACLIDGLTDESRKEAEEFLSPELLPRLKEIHVIDSFVRPGFWDVVTEKWRRYAEAGANFDGGDGYEGVKVVEVSYTYRGHEDAGFLARVHGEELVGLIAPSSSAKSKGKGKGMLGAAFNLVEVQPEEIPDIASPETDIKDAEGNNIRESKKKEVVEGILPFASDSRATEALKKRFQEMDDGKLEQLKVLSLSMWTLTVGDLGMILEKIGIGDGQEREGLIDLTVSVLLTDTWASELVKLFNSSAALGGLTGLEIVGVPAKAVAEGEDWRVGSGILDASQKDRVAELGESCKQLQRVEMSILKARKAGMVRWTREDGGEWSFQTQ